MHNSRSLRKLLGAGARTRPKVASRLRTTGGPVVSSSSRLHVGLPDRICSHPFTAFPRNHLISPPHFLPPPPPQPFVIFINITQQCCSWGLFQGALALSQARVDIPTSLRPSFMCSLKLIRTHRPRLYLASLFSFSSVLKPLRSSCCCALNPRCTVRARTNARTGMQRDPAFARYLAFSSALASSTFHHSLWHFFVRCTSKIPPPPILKTRHRPVSMRVYKLP